jgi:hypothetical protein
LNFKWGEYGKREAAKKRNEVRDTLLKIVLEGGDVQYVLLRDLRHQGNRIHLPLSSPAVRQTKSKQPQKKPAPRPWILRWADEIQLAQTKLEFLIRRWRVTWNVQGEHTPLVIEGDRHAHPSAKDSGETIHGAVRLHIEIDSKEQPWNIAVRITFEQDQIERTQEHLREKLENLQDELSRTFEAEDLFLVTAILETKKDLAEVKAFLEIARIYRFLGEPKLGDSSPKLERAELSLIVCLKLDDDTILDVARFGDFAPPEK